MEYRAPGRSGLRVSVLTMGTMTFGGSGPFANVGTTCVTEARRQVDMCLDPGVNLIDTADVCSAGQAEEILGQVLRGRRDRVLVATKVRMPMGRDPNDAGLWRHHVISGCEPVYGREHLWDTAEALIATGAQHGVAASLTLTQAERSDLDQTAALPLIYPCWHQVKTARDRLSPADLNLLGPRLS